MTTTSTTQSVSNPFDCPHTHQRLCRFIRSNGSVIARYQCLLCGRDRQVLARKDVPNFDQLPWWDESLRQRCREERLGWVREQARIREEQWAVRNEDWWARYYEHLKSPYWQEIKRQVRIRANGICERCHNGPIAHTHHLTYDRMGAELLTDVEGLCIYCHHEEHPHRDMLWQHQERERQAGRRPLNAEDWAWLNKMWKAAREKGRANTSPS